MRLVQLLIPNGTRESVLAVLDGEDIDYMVWEETGRGDFEAVFSFPVPESGVEPMLEKLETAGIRGDTYSIVTATEAAVSERIGSLGERFTGLRSSREELTARARDLAPTSSTYVAFLVLSAVIATAGLLLDSAATMIGAMVVAPLMGPAITALVGVAIAVALIPPAATVGLGIAWGVPLVAIASGTLVLVNLLAINLSALALFKLAGYRPLATDTLDQSAIRRGVLKRIGGIVAAIRPLSVVLGAVTIGEFYTHEVELQLANEGSTMLDEPDYDGLHYEGVVSEFHYVQYLTGSGYEVEVIVGVEEGTDTPPDLARQLDERMSEAVGLDLSVRVAFLDEQVSA
jgi:uncharacterized membrane protein